MMMVATVSWQATRIDKLKSERDSLSEKLSAQQVINTTTLTAVATFHRISGETIDAKRKNTLDTQTAKKDVKVILVGNDCASAAAPGALIDRMRQYKD
ncbi:TPA: hypothetical protein ON571_001681 [Morganella morganii]|nr:hypothetical protein [Morganella morganii]